MKRSLVALLLLLGCAHEHFRTLGNGKVVRLCSLPELVVTDTSIPDQYYPAIVSGFEYWNMVIGKRVFFNADRLELDTEKQESFGFIAVGILTNQETPTGGHERAATFQKYDGNGCVRAANILVNPKSFDGDLERFETTIRHEFGHVLGLQHSADFTDLMYKAPSSERTMQHPRDATNEEVKVVRGVYQ